MNLLMKRQGFSSVTTMMAHKHVLETLQIYIATKLLAQPTILCSDLDKHYESTNFP